MSDPLYRKELLRLAADAHGAGRLPDATATGHAHNPVCGDKVVIDVVLEDGRVVKIGQEAKACVLTQASASILGKSLKGAARGDVEALRGAIRAMLEAHGPVPGTPFQWVSRRFHHQHRWDERFDRARRPLSRRSC
jgi:NifU-like protein involved in Fe-S cluster formation